MVFLIIGLGILFYGKKNFKKSFMLFLCYRLFLVTNITILSIPGVPLLTLDFFMSFIYVCIFFLNGKKYQMATMAFPYRRSFKIVVFSMTLSSIFAVAGFAAESTALVGAIVQNYLMTWLIWQMVNDKEDFDYLFKCMTIVFLLSCIYALFEYTIKSNPLQLYEATLNPTKTIDYSYSHDTRRGYRARSIFEHPIGAGINWAVYAVFSLSLYVQRKNFPHATTSIITTFLCFICILLTKMRSPLIFLFIAIIGIVNFKEKKFYFLTLLVVVLFIICWPIFLKNNAVLQSLFNQDARQTVGGSNLEMRIDQFKFGFSLLKMSPIVGLGRKFESVLPFELTYGILGKESIWLIVMTEYGLLGIVAYVFLAIDMVLVIPWRNKNKMLFFMALAYWATSTVSSLPGFCEYLMYLVFFYYIKTGSRYTMSRKKGEWYGIYFHGFKIRYKKREQRRQKSLNTKTENI